MVRDKVSSSRLDTVGYDAEAQILEIEFLDTSIYQFFDVPQSVYTDLMNAASKTHYFTHSIWDRYDMERVK